MNTSELFAGLATSLILFVVGTLATLATGNHRSTLRRQLAIFHVAFAARFALSILLYVFGMNASIVGAGDDSGWAAGIGIKESWQAQGIGPLEWPVALLDAYKGHHVGYGYLLAVFFSVVNLPSQLSAAAVDCLCGAMVAVFAYRIARLLFSEWVAIRVGWATCCFPLMIIWSAQSIKEPMVILLETTALYGCCSLRKKGFRIRHIVLTAVSVMILPTFRFYAAYVVGAAVLLTLALPQIHRRRMPTQIHRRRMPIIAAMVVAAVVLPLWSSTGVLSRDTKAFQEWDVKGAMQFRKDIAAGTGSGAESDYDMETNRGLSLATLDGAAHLLLAPFPWELRFGSARMLLTLPEMVVWWVLFWWAFLPGIWHAIRYRFGETIPLLLFLLGLGLIYSMTFGNVGVVYRQRAQLMPYLLMFTALGLELRRNRREVQKRRKKVAFSFKSTSHTVDQKQKIDSVSTGLHRS
jgi:hypothetical protein